jgi:hypothetical protein
VTITATWMDGKQATYECPAWKVADGVLYLDPPAAGPGTEETRRIIPLNNIRICTETGRHVA